MTIAQWDIFTARVSDRNHPWSSSPRRTVSPEFPERAGLLHSLLCPPGRSPHEIILDEADGLERPTLCKLSLIHLVKAGELHLRRGRVCAERQRQMGTQLIRLFGLWRG